MRNINLLSIFYALIITSSPCSAVDVQLIWDPSPTENVTYILYATTNILSSTNLHSSQVKADTGTNCGVTIRDMDPGIWTFAATAVKTSINIIPQTLAIGIQPATTTNKVESDPSNFLILEIPSPPAMARTMVLEATTTLTGTNWIDAGFFRLRITP